MESNIHGATFQYLKKLLWASLGDFRNNIAALEKETIAASWIYFHLRRKYFCDFSAGCIVVVLYMNIQFSWS